MKYLMSALVAGVLAAGAASATTLTVDFQVTTETNGGEPGTPSNPNNPAARAATATGSITFDTTNAVGSILGGVPTFSGAVTDIDIVIDGVAVNLNSAPTRNNVEQIQNPGDGDTLAMTVTDGFGATGAAFGVAEVVLDLRFLPTADIFSDGGLTLFDDVVDGLSLNASDIDLFRLSVEYAGTGISFSDSSIFTLFSFGPGGIGANGEFINVTGTAGSVTPPVPLPAGLPLLLGGLGAFAYLRRRQH